MLARAGIFQGVDPERGFGASSPGSGRSPCREHTVFAEGERGDRLYIIASGKVKIVRRSPDGRENLLTIMGPPDMFGELSALIPARGRRA